MRNIIFWIGILCYLLILVGLAIFMVWVAWTLTIRIDNIIWSWGI